MATENFKQLVKGNPVSQIVKAINFLQPKFRQQLMSEYGVKTVEELAFKLQ